MSTNDRPFFFGVAIAALLFLPACGGTAVGPSGSDGGTADTGTSSTADAAAAVCTIAPPSTATLPHVSADAKAAGITKALDAIFAAHTPPVSPGATYAIAKLGCSNLQTILNDANGPRCGFNVTAGGKTTAIDLPPPSTLAQALMSALVAA